MLRLACSPSSRFLLQLWNTNIARKSKSMHSSTFLLLYLRKIWQKPNCIASPFKVDGTTYTAIAPSNVVYGYLLPYFYLNLCSGWAQIAGHGQSTIVFT